jgi:hypothetical protein
MPPDNAHWEEFAVADPDPLGLDGNDRSRLSTISHVTHVEIALNIVRDGIIRPQLVYDESKLNVGRILVVWLSPNHWFHGYRYGNVRFRFDWKSLVAEKNYYWVESMPYSITACRILITAEDRDGQHELIPYDPAVHRGPWIYDPGEDRHYWNGNYTLEIMLESELLLSQSSEVSFVKHHDHGCCISPQDCPDKGLAESIGGRRFVAGIIARQLPTLNLKLTQEQNGNILPSAALNQALGAMFVWPAIATCGGTVLAETPEGQALARAIYSVYYREDDEERGSLGRQFANRDELRLAMLNLAKNTFGITL